MSKIADIGILETPTPLAWANIGNGDTPPPLKHADVLNGWSPQHYVRKDFSEYDKQKRLPDKKGI